MKKDIYFTIVNLNGLIYKKPLKGKWNTGLENWWNDLADIDCSKIGLYNDGIYTTFSSYNKKDVENFIKGCQSINNVLKNMVN